MRNPNGYGTVVKLSGNRRKPYCARKTISWTDKGHPVYSAIGYYRTREEAMIALADYNKEPYDLSISKITLLELFERWAETELKRFSPKRAQSLRTACRNLEPLWHHTYRSLRSYHFQSVIDRHAGKPGTQGNIKALCAKLDAYAMAREIITVGHGSALTVESVPTGERTPFTRAEVQRVWDNADLPFAKEALFLLYTGFRAQELASLQTKNVDLEALTMRGGVKTAAGKNRIVPIHPRIEFIVRERYSSVSSTLFSRDGKPYSYDYLYLGFKKLMETLSMHHCMHECRHTFRTFLDSAGGNARCLDLLLGHASDGVGARVYTHKTIDELRATILLLE